MPGNPLSDPTLATQFADTIERLVGTVRGKTTRPLLKVYRAVMFGVVAAIGGTVAIVLLIIALVRALQAFFDIFLDSDDAVWVSYLVVGVIFSVLGLIAMKRRFPTEEQLEAGL